MKPSIKRSGNGTFVGPSLRVSTDKEMRAFDRLPTVLRAALREAIADSTATGWTRHIKIIGADACAAAIQRFDREDSFTFLRIEFGVEAARKITGRDGP